ncbi:hypothetical protein SETIT_7G023200v2 [Setaria italica]|uniref:Uncharacterized protein n=1 Tax=Setaria italica TaxID=4555 RepID=A0A368RR76_SETIT|nr:hypothetical protein SETIT_7G023200v2 [Setaria italica]
MSADVQLTCTSLHLFLLRPAEPIPIKPSAAVTVCVWVRSHIPVSAPTEPVASCHPCLSRSRPTAPPAAFALSAVPPAMEHIARCRSGEDGGCRWSPLTGQQTVDAVGHRLPVSTIFCWGKGLLEQTTEAKWQHCELERAEAKWRLHEAKPVGEKWQFPELERAGAKSRLHKATS